MMRLRFTIPDLLWLTLVVLLRPAVADDTPTTLDTIINAWKAREEKVQTFDFRWWSKRFESADLDNKGGDDAVFFCRWRLVGDAKGRVRFESKGREWDRAADYVNRTRIEVFDGTYVITFTQDWGRRRYPLATIGSPGISMTSGVLPTVSRSLDAVPVIIALRPTKIANAAFGNYQNLEYDRGTGLGTSGPNNHSKVDFDSAKDFLPTRFTMPFEKAKKQIEIDYVPDETAGWMPRSWKYTFTGETGKLILSDEATVMQLSINRPVEEGEFKLDYPNETVFDAPQEVYILRAGGRRERVRPGVMSRETYQRILDSEPDAK